MLTFTFTCQDEAQYAALQQAANFIAEMHQLSQTAAEGAILDAVEGLALDAGRQLLREVLQTAVQARIDRDEAKKGAPPAAARARARSAPRGGTAATS